MPWSDNTYPSAAFLAQFTLNPAQDAFVRCAERFSFYIGSAGVSAPPGSTGCPARLIV